jgi:hypothetical protein
MIDPRHPAAYICVTRASGARALAWQGQAIAEVALQRGWPAPAVYADQDGDDLADGHSPALAGLIAAISAGRHDALLVTGLGAISGGPAYLLSRLLLCCTNHGVAVEFLTSPATASGPVIPAPDAAEQSPPCPLPREAWSVLARARLEALDGLFPDWRIWLDQHGWHARRRIDAFKQDYLPGAPAFCVHADSSVDLAAQMCWQRAADQHAPSGCSSGSLAHSRER